MTEFKKLQQQHHHLLSPVKENTDCAETEVNGWTHFHKFNTLVVCMFTWNVCPLSLCFQMTHLWVIIHIMDDSDDGVSVLDSA